MVIRVILALVVALVLAAVARADDAERRVRVALALAGGAPDAERYDRVSAALCGCGGCEAPMPRVKTPPAKAPCICGSTCKCKPGECPGKCPVAAAPAEAATELWLINGQYYRLPAGRRPGLALPGSSSSCPGGNCPQQRR